jgi:hypothetical protein
MPPTITTKSNNEIATAGPLGNLSLFPRKDTSPSMDIIMMKAVRKGAIYLRSWVKNRNIPAIIRIAIPNHFNKYCVLVVSLTIPLLLLFYLYP